MKKLLDRIPDLNLVLYRCFERVSKFSLRGAAAYSRFMVKSPYARLMRLDKPVGYLLLVLPVLWAVAFNARGFLEFLWWGLFFFLGAVITRSAGCIINDIVDKDLDMMVARTRMRPLACKELTVRQAVFLLGILLIIAFLMLLKLPRAAVFIGVIIVFFVAIYPFMKRVTYFPQFFLGFTFNLGVLIAWTAMTGHLSIHALLLYLCSAIWTAGYDTIYAYQDREDDLKIGIKSMALKLPEEGATKVIWNLYQFTVLALSIVGLAYHMNFAFYILMAVAAYHLYWQTETVNIKDPESCGLKFKSNIAFAFIVLAAILIGKI